MDDTLRLSFLLLSIFAMAISGRDLQIIEFPKGACPLDLAG
jgi:hypothetical protein